MDIAWSPDGTRFAYSARSCDYAATDCLSEIRIMSADGATDVRIMSGANGYKGGHAMAWSPDGQRIAFHAWNERLGPQTAALFVMNADGSNLTRLGELRAMYPAWSPDGNRIAYSAFEASDRWGIGVANADGSSPVALTTSVGSTDGRSDSEPSWSPDGQHIAFGRSWPVADQNGRGQIFVMNADGSSVRQHTKDDVCARSPSWSTDGAGIAFTGSSTPGILFVNTDGSGTRVLRQMIPGARVTWGPAHE
jgi:Tol biopolymer transport system component